MSKKIKKLQKELKELKASNNFLLKKVNELQILTAKQSLQSISYQCKLDGIIMSLIDDLREFVENYNEQQETECNCDCRGNCDCKDECDCKKDKDDSQDVVRFSKYGNPAYLSIEDLAKTIKFVDVKKDFVSLGFLDGTMSSSSIEKDECDVISVRTAYAILNRILECNDKKTCDMISDLISDLISDFVDNNISNAEDTETTKESEDEENEEIL